MFSKRQVIYKRLLSMLLILVMLSGSALMVCAGQKDSTTNSTTMIGTSFDEAVMGVDLSWEFPYSDTMFSKKSSVYNHKLAQSSLGLALSSFRVMRNLGPDEIRAKNGISYMEQAGFTDFDCTDYDQVPSLQTVASLICSKKMTDEDGPFTVVAVGVSGGGYAMEWLSNFTLGKGERHEGFSRAAEDVKGRILVYLAEHHLTGRLKLWITGYSRAAAISNIVAADFSDYGPFGRDNVYAYTFATPRTNQEKEPGDYPNIFNIIGKMDVMPQVPLEAWGYQRYGIDLMTPAQETDSDYIRKKKKADDLHYKLTGIHFINNPEVNHQLVNLLDYLYRVCPNEEVYTDHIQETLKNMMDDPQVLTIAADIAKMADDPGLINEENYQDFYQLLDFIIAVAWDIRTDSGSIQKAWQNNISTNHNLFWEHTPSVYLAWMFSSDDPAEIFTDSRLYQRVVFEGDVRVNVYGNGTAGECLYPDGSLKREGKEAPDLFMTRVNNQSIILLPKDREYLLVQTSEKEDPVNIFCVTYDVTAPQNKEGFRVTLKGPVARYCASLYWEEGDRLGNLTKEEREECKKLGMTDVEINDYQRKLKSFKENIDYEDISENLRNDPGLLERIERVNVFHISLITILNIVVLVPFLINTIILILLVRWILALLKKKRGAKAANLTPSGVRESDINDEKK